MKKAEDLTSRLLLVIADRVVEVNKLRNADIKILFSALMRQKCLYWILLPSLSLMYIFPRHFVWEKANVTDFGAQRNYWKGRNAIESSTICMCQPNSPGYSISSKVPGSLSALWKEYVYGKYISSPRIFNYCMTTISAIPSSTSCDMGKSSSRSLMSVQPVPNVEIAKAVYKVVIAVHKEFKSNEFLDVTFTIIHLSLHKGTL